MNKLYIALLVIVLALIDTKEEPVTSSVSKLQVKEKLEFQPILVIEPINEEDLNAQAIINATIRIETGNMTSYMWLHMNNAGGIKETGVDRYRTFETKEEGIEAVEYEIKEYYYPKYGTDLKGIRDEYCGNCGEQDLNVFTEIFNEEKEKLK